MEQDAAAYFKASGMSTLINSFLNDAYQARTLDVLGFMQIWAAEQIALSQHATNANRAHRRSRASNAKPMSELMMSENGNGGSAGSAMLGDSLGEGGGGVTLIPCKTLRQLLLKEAPEVGRFHHTGSEMDLNDILNRKQNIALFCEAVCASSHVHVKALSLVNNNLDETVIQSVSKALQYLPSLTSLDISNNPELKANGVTNFSAGLDFLPTLRHLSLNAVGLCNGSEKEVVAVFNALRGSVPKRLATLSIAGNDLGSMSSTTTQMSVFLSFMEGLSAGITSLSLATNHFTQAHSKTIFRLLSGFPELKVLNYDNNDVGVAIRSLKSPPGTKTFQELSLNNCNLFEDAEYVLSYFPEACAADMKVLSLQGNYIPPNVVTLFGTSITCSFPCLETFDISGNPIGDMAVAKVLQGAALSLTTLKTLRMRGCALTGREWGVALAHFISRSSSLVEVDIGNNKDIPTHILIMIADAIKSANSTGAQGDVVSPMDTARSQDSAFDTASSTGTTSSPRKLNTVLPQVWVLFQCDGCAETEVHEDARCMVEEALGESRNILKF